MAKKSTLKSSLARSAEKWNGTPTAEQTEPEAIAPATTAAPRRAASQKPKGQPSRADTKGITVHLPKQARQQLKTLAAQQDRFIQDIMLDALNDIFRQHKMPEVRPPERDR